MNGKRARRADARMSSATESPRMPTWVKVSLIALAVVVVVGVVVAIAKPGGHGPGMHGGSVEDPSTATRTIAISAIDTAFEPASLSVARGEVVTFVVTNNGKAAHEFILGDAAMQEQHASAMEHGGPAHGGDNMIELAPGETKEITWRFDETGTILYACHEPGHYDAGMVGEIAVA